MDVTQAELAAYTASVNRQAELGRAATKALIDAMWANRPTGWHYKDVYEYAKQVIRDVLSVYGRNSATLAADFFEERTGISPRIYDGINMDYVDSKIRYLIGRIAEHDEEGFKNGLADASNYYIKRQAYENTRRNASHNGVRYARVPQGVETCAFCWMLATRGFVYDSEMSALGAHGYHVNCDCVAVAGDDSTVIEGYDLEGMRRRYREVANAAGPKPTASDIIKAARKYNWEWLYTGEGPKLREEAQ